MRLIDADALANCANNQIVGITANDIMRFPTVDAEPVKHGRLVNKGAGYIECSVCGQIYTNIAVLYKCCPYCTARFDGGAD